MILGRIRGDAAKPDSIEEGQLHTSAAILDAEIRRRGLFTSTIDPAADDGYGRNAGHFDDNLTDTSTSECASQKPGIVDDDDSHDLEHREIPLSYSDLISAEDIRLFNNRELVDVDRLVWIAEYLAARHADKKKMRTVMTSLVDAIRSSADSIELIEDDVHELILSAQTSLERLKDVHVDMCEGHESYSGSQSAR